MQDDLNRKALAGEPLSDLVMNGYYLLGFDWRETLRDWNNRSSATPPVMITVANRTDTAARIKYAFDHNRVHIEELCEAERTLHIDSKVLKNAEAGTEPIADFIVDGAGESTSDGSARKLTQKQRAELLRLQVDTPWASLGERASGYRT